MCYYNLFTSKNNVKTQKEPTKQTQPKLVVYFFDLSDKVDGFKINLDFDRIVQI